jgi:aspartate/methionine/tyrosine aminotransferase
LSKLVTVRMSARAKEISLEPFKLALDLPKDVISLSVGEPGFETPEFVREAAKKSIDDLYTHYTPVTGFADLRKAIADKLRRDNSLSYDYEKEVVVTPGSAVGVFMAMLTLLDPGDQILITDPAWFHYDTLANLCGAEPVRSPVRFEGDVPSLDLAATKRLVTRKTKAIILNNPMNPMGTSFSRDVLEEVGDFAEKHNLWIISDEVYEKIVYPPNKHISPASLPGLKERTLTSNGMSKGYVLPGFRVGYLAGPPDILERIGALTGYMLVCASSMSQRAAYVALTDPRMDTFINETLVQYTKRRKMVLDTLSGVRGISLHPPQGTFYAWIDIKGTGMSSEKFTKKLAEEQKVGVMPGPLFGKRGKGHIRISFATAEDKLKVGLERIRDFVVDNTTNM